ncbi:WD40 repeat domain-containing protein [Streptomyces profundus]|uniref:WD40 repeat domain-containing protein n=1 Tax=Streptomyces profundus TaxID=2867410 RepID=UPI001D16E8F1|nr:hypothetical protein [Streptomyces sp. MA3_2.13]UED87841.1 hypothetical protein K4G22_29590 [Streptomyces sp. MA3_2.13]
MKRTPTLSATATVGALAALLAGCGGGPSPGAEPAPTETPHGYVEGAEETAEATSRLVLADAGTGAVAVLDLATEEITELPAVPGVRQLRGDGRFAYLGADDGSVHLVDSGGWTVDHGDHVHHYRADPAALGALPVGELASAHADTARTALTGADGTVRLLDRDRLAEGEPPEPVALSAEGRLGTAVPHAGHLLVTAGADTPDTVRIRDAAGEPLATLDEPCPEAGGAAATRRGVVFACADGALLVAEEDGAFTGTPIPYPDGVEPAQRAQEFTHRPGSDTLAARAGDDAAWALDLAERTWTRIDTGPLTAVNAVGDGKTLLALADDGVLHAYDTDTGRRTASTPLLATPPDDAAPAPVIEVDTSRAYVNDPAAGVVHEIDYRDDLRLARTLEPGLSPDHMVETGR